MAWATARVLGDRNARLYLSGVFVAGFGDSAMALAAGVWVKTTTGSDALAGVVNVGLWLALLLGPVLGGVADRVNRRRLLVAVNLALGAVMVVVAAGHVWLVFAGLTLVGVGAVLIEAAEAALLPSALPAGLRGDFNGLTRTVTEGMKLFAPAAGAALFAWLGGPPVALLNAATFVAAALAFGLLRVRAPEPAPVASVTAPSPARVAVLRNRELRALILAGAAAMVASSLSSSATFALLDALHRPPAYAGVLTPAQGLGSVAGGLLAGTLMRRWGERGYATLGLTLFAVGALLRATPWTWSVLVGCVLIGLGLPAPLIAAITAVQRLIPQQALGRAAATANSVMFVPTGPALLLGGLAVSTLDYRVQTVAAAALAGAAALATRLDTITAWARTV
ncbi:MFS transporter [Dactylosporangium sp. NPDC049140]|uniref:MFS transporter n=1 Tax=Dactylosporangium sp. NPDC049140 TaxID=3155647 RepID=UPI0033C0CC8E